MKANLLLSTAAVGLMITGAFAQTGTNDHSQRSQVERIKDPARQQNSRAEQPRNAGEAQEQAKNGQQSGNSAVVNRSGQSSQQTGNDQQKDVRTVYPNTQRAGEQNLNQQQKNDAKQSTENRQPNSLTRSQNNSQSSAQNGGQPNAQPSTTAGGAAQQQATQPSQSQPPQPANQNARQSAPPSQNTQQSAQGGQNSQQSKSGVVALNTKQQTSIRQTIARHNVKPLANVNFSISVGTAVPRSVQLRALPSDLVTFVPQYRGYSYFVVEEQIVIVEPSSHEIVAVVPYTGNRTVQSSTRTAHTSAPMTSRSVNLNAEERQAIRSHATQSRTNARAVRKHQYREGERVPSSVTIEEFPETVYTEVPRVRSYRYFRDDDDDVVLVDPYQDRVIETIR